jgi:hypothetical protein
LGDHGPDTFHHRREVNLDLRDADAQRVRTPGVGGPAGGRDQGLAGRAAEVDAGAAEMRLLDQDDLAPGRGQGAGERHAGLPAADDGRLGRDLRHAPTPRT